MYIVNIREQSKGATFLERARFDVGSKFSVVYQMHRYSVILFEIVKVMVATALLHLCFGGDSTLNYAKSKV